MTDPRDMARQVVLDGLRRDTPLFVALQYLGLVDSDALHAAFPGELVEPEPEPTTPQDAYMRVRPSDGVASEQVAWWIPGGGLDRQREFAAWMEGEGPWREAFVEPGRG